MNIEKMKIILATDCGSTTTKARLFTKIKGEYRFSYSGEAPTTVETPYEDVTMGVRNAVHEIEELSGLNLINENGIIIRKMPEGDGVDLYVTTSSAGGGLQMMVFSVTKKITGQSVQRAALGGGAIVMSMISVDDGIPIYKKVQLTRHLRPDMVLMAGGTDGGSVIPIVKISEILRLAEPKARFGLAFSLPVIFAGNKDARKKVEETLENKFTLMNVDNIRPKVELENTDPARDAIQKLFMEHVMAHAPGYDKLMKWTDVEIMPTPMGEGMMFQTIAKTMNINVIGVGLGGATTNVYSIFDDKFVRTVSANLGMSYSICNVLRESGIENIIRWIPFDIDERTLSDILTNKMIRPTTIPQTINELIIEHAVAREALRLGLAHHKVLARGLRGIRPAASLDAIFSRKAEGSESYIDMLRVQIIGGTGGLLSHSPRRIQSGLILIDAWEPEGITRLVQDSVFMMPHLGVLSTIHPKASMEIFEKDCLIKMGTCIAPRGIPKKEEDEIMNVEINMSDGRVMNYSLKLGDLIRIPLETGDFANVNIKPNKECDLGAGSGHSIKAKVEGGVFGIILDARGRPIKTLNDRKEMKKLILKWFHNLDMYPKKFLEKFEGN